MNCKACGFGDLHPDTCPRCDAEVPEDSYVTELREEVTHLNQQVVSLQSDIEELNSQKTTEEDHIKALAKLREDITRLFNRQIDDMKSQVEKAFFCYHGALKLVERQKATNEYLRVLLREWLECYGYEARETRLKSLGKQVPWANLDLRTKEALQ